LLGFVGQFLVDCALNRHAGLGSVVPRESVSCALRAVPTAFLPGSDPVSVLPRHNAATANNTSEIFIGPGLLLQSVREMETRKDAALHYPILLDLRNNPIRITGSELLLRAIDQEIEVFEHDRAN
jgi:hypothetical protein